MNEDKKWYRDCRNFKLKQPDGEYWELQNKSKFINIGSQEAEIALRVVKILFMCIMEKSWADLRSILEEVFMCEFWINFLVITRSDYLKEIRKLENCSLLCKKVKSSIESQFDEKISSGHDNKMGAKDDGKVKTYKILI